MSSRVYFVLAFLLVCPAVVCARPAEEVIHDRFATVNGVKLHYLQAGSGTESPIVLLHGYAQTSHMWRPLMPMLRIDTSSSRPTFAGRADPTSRRPATTRRASPRTFTRWCSRWATRRCGSSATTSA